MALPLYVFETVILLFLYLQVVPLESASFSLPEYYWWWSVLYTMGGILAHELLHAMGFVLFGHVKPSEIQFGAHWRYFAFYAHAQKPMSKKAYRISLWIPFWTLGIAPLVYSCIKADFGVFLFACLFTTSAVGDLIMAYLIEPLPKESFLQDHPSKIGCLAYSQTEISFDREGRVASFLSLGNKMNKLSIVLGVLILAQLVFFSIG